MMNLMASFQRRIGMSKSKMRYDSAKVKAHFDENGFLVDTPVVARVGVQTYYMPDGSDRKSVV